MSMHPQGGLESQELLSRKNPPDDRSRFIIKKTGNLSSRLPVKAIRSPDPSVWVAICGNE